MTAQILDGKAVANERLLKLADKVAERRKQGLRPPCLAVLLVGSDPASVVYVNNKKNCL